VISLGDNYHEACQTFQYVRVFLTTIIDALVQSQIASSWRTTQISNPAATEITITMHLPELRVCQASCSSVQRERGITLLDFAEAFVSVTRQAFKLYSLQDIIHLLEDIHGHTSGDDTGYIVQ
jgi:hypothetical protein